MARISNRADWSSVTIFHNETKAKLIYDTNTPDFEGDEFGEDIPQIVDLVISVYQSVWDAKFWGYPKHAIDCLYIVNAIFTLFIVATITVTIFKKQHCIYRVITLLSTRKTTT